MALGIIIVMIVIYEAGQFILIFIIKMYYVLILIHILQQVCVVISSKFGSVQAWALQEVNDFLH